jgi:hypothetical protein
MRLPDTDDPWCITHYSGADMVIVVVSDLTGKIQRCFQKLYWYLFFHHFDRIIYPFTGAISNGIPGGQTVH